MTSKTKAKGSSQIGATSSPVTVADLQAHVASVSGEFSPGALAVAASDPDVDFCVSDEVVTADVMQLGPLSWGLDRVDQRSNTLNGMFETGGTDGEGVDIYVLDTGVNQFHEDFEGRLKGGFNAVRDGNGDDDWDDCNGHGSHCAGSAAGTEHGVAKRASIFGVRVLGAPAAAGDSAARRREKRCSKSGSWSSVLNGIDWVIARAGERGRPAVASMSIGGGKNLAVNRAVRLLRDAGVVPVVAAGNSFTDACRDSPGSSPDAITVGATDRDDTLWRWHSDAGSNWGGCVDILAPGVAIVAPWHSTTTGVATQTGTSMAAPHVAGAAALVASNLMRAANNGAIPSVDAVKEALLSRAVDGAIDLSAAPMHSTPNKMLFTAFKEPIPDYFAPQSNHAAFQRRLREAGK